MQGSVNNGERCKSRQESQMEKIRNNIQSQEESFLQ